jgi:hypothetical protein
VFAVDPSESGKIAEARFNRLISACISPDFSWLFRLIWRERSLLLQPFLSLSIPECAWPGVFLGKIVFFLGSEKDF